MTRHLRVTLDLELEDLTPEQVHALRGRGLEGTPRWLAAGAHREEISSNLVDLVCDATCAGDLGYQVKSVRVARSSWLRDFWRPLSEKRK